MSKGGFFSHLFKKKSSSNKENELPHEPESFIRSSLHGHRKSQRRDKDQLRARFEQELVNPYSVPSAPRTYRATESCPGGIKEDYENRRYRRSIHQTSEYGSGDPSPVGNTSVRGRHYDVNDDSDADDYEYEGMRADREIKHLQSDLETMTRKYKVSEEKRMYQKKKIKEQEREIAQLRNRYEKLEMTKDENEEASAERTRRLKRECDQLQKRLMAYEQQHQQMHPFAAPFNSSALFPFPQHNRLSLMQPMNMQSSTETPLTSATGAGEALTEQSDISYTQGFSNFESTFDNRSRDDTDLDKPGRSPMEVARSSVMSSSFTHEANQSIPLIDQNADSVSTVVASPVVPTKTRKPAVKRSISFST